MDTLAALWLPILLSAVAVFVLSSLLHMVLPWHRNDYPKMPNEQAAMDALRPLAIPAGEYMVPRPETRQALRSAEFLDRVNRGPVFMLTMWPNGMAGMGKALVRWFVYDLVVAALAGHIAWAAAPAGLPRVFHVIALTAFMGYSVALWQMSIWYHRPWRTTLKGTVDGLIYGMATGGVFVWLWPR